MGTAGTRAIEYRTLGKTDLRVSLLGYGTSPFGDIYAKTDPAELERTVHARSKKASIFSTPPLTTA